MTAGLEQTRREELDDVRVMSLVIQDPDLPGGWMEVIVPQNEALRSFDPHKRIMLLEMEGEDQVS